jgi:type IV secretion system protein VirB3
MAHPEALRQTVIHRALHRPQIIMGGERELMLFSMLVAGGLILSAMNYIATGLGIVIWMVCVYCLRRMAKADPQMSKIYRRQISYAHYYAPFSRPFREAKTKRIK